jgi:hypothetical protein
MWILLIIALNITDSEDSKDIPAKIEIPFETQAQCEHAKYNMTYWIKYKNFKLLGKCTKQF